jgi:enamine deaminase RidA (YjgF/YER057c/UK114 family)
MDNIPAHLRPALERMKAKGFDLRRRLDELGLQLPDPPKPVASYLPACASGDLIFVSGQLPMKAGQLLASGPVASACSLENAQAGARQCVLNALAIVDAGIAGLWFRFERVVRIGVFVASEASFTEQHKVANGASDFLVEIFGEQGKHARAAVGVPCLPLGASVEVEFTFAVRGKPPEKKRKGLGLFK